MEKSILGLTLLKIIIVLNDTMRSMDLLQSENVRMAYTMAF